MKIIPSKRFKKLLEVSKRRQIESIEDAIKKAIEEEKEVIKP